MNDLFPNQSYAFKEPDEDSVLAFLSDCHALEGALVRAGFTRPGLTPGTLRPDWNQFARRMADKFDWESDPALTTVVWTLVDQPGTYQPRGPVSVLARLTERVREIRERVLLGVNYGGGPPVEDMLVAAASFLVEEWRFLDLERESMSIPWTAA